MGRIGINDNSNGKNIKDLLESHPLAFHFLPDGMDRFGPALEFIPDSKGIEFLRYRLRKLPYQPVSRGGCLFQPGFNIIILSRFHEFHGQVFHLRLDIIVTEPVRQWCE